MTLFGEDRADPGTGLLPPDPPSPISSISFVGEQYGRIPAWGRDGPLLFRTDDGGRSWEAIDQPPPNVSIHTSGDRAFFLTPQTGWSWGNVRGMTTTQDGGRTWTNLDPLFGHAISFEHDADGWYHGGNHATPDGGWPPSQYGIYITQDGGGHMDARVPHAPRRCRAGGV